MYTEQERKDFFDQIISKVEQSAIILGTYLIGSSSIGFNDIYSDCDFMMAYKEDVDVKKIRNEILTFWNQDDVGYIIERKWSPTIWGISVYFKNGISADISFGPLSDLRIASNQITVGVDTDGLLEEYLKKGLERYKQKVAAASDYDGGWDFMYLIRKIKIAIERKNYIYAYQVLNDARLLVMNVEGKKENQKMHQFKAYDKLNSDFLKRITETTIPKEINRVELERCYNSLLEIYYSLVDNFDENLKYLLVI